MIPQNRRRRKVKKTELSEVQLSSMPPEEQEAFLHQKRLGTPLTEIPGITVRMVNTLEREGILTAKDLLDWSVEELLDVSNFGETTLAEIKQSLVKFGLTPEWKLTKKSRARTSRRKK